MSWRRWIAIAGAGALLAGGWFARAQAASGPQAWEYRQFVFHGDYDRLDSELLVMGSEGYELILVSPQETVAIFKRPAR